MLSSGEVSELDEDEHKTNGCSTGERREYGETKNQLTTAWFTH